ncbi:trypsin-like peptidase domain-containing protein (plasmid) [Nostoc sp. UHCC 0926]|uniref:VMAP-C domain-containing protein n=1 Tax=Nostoc sp. UHCC 0926 TaxID=3025190 RepID=UPI00235F1DCE|nr:trypsin-like peptidase domain-containing protein [Nostoc sp. UHCC 0926]WDD36064.1 trypsin-like peptidase domain-containing protein [Nostoc sp. UHCC 0926]
MTFTVEDYEKAIARIFLLKQDKKEHVIGTGFLIAPGYVLTCAHVVLQANNVDADNFTNDKYKKQPETEIYLDFPVLASGQKINAKVVVWLPYNLENGDVAVLKLLTPHPQEAKPMPLVEVSRAEVENDKHSVYGFGKSPAGGRSDAYRPKANVAGGRFQLCKYGDPNDETIQPGFSGAPVWNDSRQCVIGMVATATVANDKEEKQNTAYAIPIRQLQTILKQVNAFCLHDILAQSLNRCGSNEKQDQFRKAINKALLDCNPQGSDRTWQQQLVDLSIDRPPPTGWETEGRLVYFVMMLALINGRPTSALEELKAWVERCGHKYSDLFVRFNDEMKQKNVLASNECECLMVAVEQVETSTDELRVSLWAVPNRETYNADNPPMPLVPEKVVSRQELPVFVRDLIREKLNPEPTPTIHLFVPRKLFGENFEMLSASPMLGAVLGSEYPFVVRTNPWTHPIGKHYKHEWHKKWKQLEEALEKKSGSEVKIIDCSQPPKNLISKIKGIYAARLKECNSVDNLFDLIAETTALPVALWSRDPQFQKHLADVLKCTVKDLPERIRQEREKAYNSDKKSLLGHHLSLVWEDPKIVPPDMQFYPE